MIIQTEKSVSVENNGNSYLVIKENNDDYCPCINTLFLNCSWDILPEKKTTKRVITSSSYDVLPFQLMGENVVIFFGADVQNFD